MTSTNIHEQYMKLALRKAGEAYQLDEVPVGAIIIKDDQVIAEAHNTNESNKSVINHAEINCIEQACKKLDTKNLSGCSIYITLEPCMMCLGAIMNAKISNVYFGAFDLEYGNLISNEYYKLDKNINWHSGILKDECSKILSDYFKNKR